MKIQPLTEHLGAGATGIDLMCDQKQLADPLRAALLDRGVLIPLNMFNPRWRLSASPATPSKEAP